VRDALYEAPINVASPSLSSACFRRVMFPTVLATHLSNASNRFAQNRAALALCPYRALNCYFGPLVIFFSALSERSHLWSRMIGRVHEGH
jgi:hypothetical protein